MKNNEGGSMASIALFVIGFGALVAALVVYTMKDDTTSKKWVEQTRAIIENNEALGGQIKDAVSAFETVCKNHTTLAEELARQKEQLAKLEYAQTLPAKPLTLPSTINFTVVERRRVIKEDQKPAEKLNGAHPLPKQPTKPDAKVIKNIKKRMKELSQ